MTNPFSTGVLSTPASKVAAVLVCLCALVGGGVVGLLVPHDDGPAKVVLEPINKVARDSWLKHGVDAQTGSERRIGSEYARYRPGEDVPDSRQHHTTATLAGDTVSGADAGVYGGSRDTQVCDKTALIQYLTDPANATRAMLWAKVLGLQPEQIENYITGLTGARLRWDTRVTDSGIDGTDVTQWQALLQAGTAVLVDNTGMPRVKCDSGSPLLAPEGLRTTSDGDLDLNDVAQNPSDAWSGLDPADAVSINPGRDPLQSLTIVDVSGDDMLQRDVGSDGASSQDVGTGDVQFNLKWTSRADLDIHVTDPDGYTYGYEDRYYTEESPNGGDQDIDANYGCERDDRDASGFAKENVFWPPGQAPTGTYTVYVRGFLLDSNCAGAVRSGAYTLTVTIGGQVHTMSGVVGNDQNSQTWTFTKPN